MGEEPTGRLDGWKGIAAHLRVSIRTAQRWEREYALPVRHAGGTRGASVFAFRDELDQWVRPPLTLQDEPEPVAETRTGGRIRWLAWTGVAGAVLLAAIVWVGGVVLSQRRQPEIGEVTFSGQQVVAWNRGRVAWSYDMGQRINDTPSPPPTDRIRIEDLYGDGRREVLVAAPLLLRDVSNSDALYCFTSRGRLLWREPFDSAVDFGGEHDAPHWVTGALLVTSSGAPTIWTSVCNQPDSASIITKTDVNGYGATYFVNFGWLAVLAEFRISGQSYLLAGGINNEYDCAALAVLKESEPGGRSPQTGPFAECHGCPAGQPFRYFLFPRSELNRVSGLPYNDAHWIVSAGHAFDVMTAESRLGAGSSDWARYTFSERFVPRSVMFSDEYWEHHKQLSSKNVIDHDVKDCPERLKPIMVREWSPEEGWRSIAVAPLPSPIASSGN